MIFWTINSHTKVKTPTTNPVALANLKSPVFSHKVPHPSYQLASDPVTFADLKSPPAQMTKVKHIQISNNSDMLQITC